MPTPAKSSLFKRNRAAFRKYQPQLWAELERIATTVSKPVLDDDGVAVNIDLGEVRLYAEPAPAWTAEQVDDYFKKPDRVGFEDPAHCNLSAVTVEVLHDVAHYFSEKKGLKGSAYPVVDVGFAFVFGIGLGYHLPELLRRRVARNILLIEPVPEFVLHSMHAIDWGKLFREARAKGMVIHFIVGRNPARAVESIESLIRGVGSTFLDGSYAYSHYYSWALQESRTALNEKIKVFYLSSGYFEDEILMMRNTYGNLREHGFRLVDRRPRVAQHQPMFVVGSGPSLDRDIEAIKKWRDRVIVFSCGTSLGILLKNGIRPDLHVENENTLPLVNNLRDFKETYGLDGIRLVASSTLQPEASGLFDSRWFYYRAPLSSSMLLSGGTEPLLHADPLVVNAACAAAAYLGFQDIYLFGVDCGRRFQDEHHSKDAVYFQEGYEINPFDRPDAGFERVVPGNFGGQVLTSWSLDLSRRSLTFLMHTRGLAFTNCSHGARIDGARPKVSAAIEITAEPGRQEAVLSAIEQSLSHFEAGELLERIDIRAHADAYDDFVPAFNEMIDKAIEEDQGFWEFEQRVEKFWYDDWSEHKGVLKIMGGSYASLVRLGAFAGTRVKSRKGRIEFLRFFIERFRETCLWMAGEAHTLLDEMADGKETLSDVGQKLPAEEVPAEEPA